MIYPILSVALGGAFGSVARWLVSSRLNPVFLHLPLGTLVVNLVGSLLIGMLIALFLKMPTSIDSHWRLFLITGFCGGFTTFSSFSGEVALMLQDEAYSWAFITMASHLLGSLGATFLGFLLIHLTLK